MTSIVAPSKNLSPTLCVPRKTSAKVDVAIVLFRNMNRANRECDATNIVVKSNSEIQKKSNFITDGDGPGKNEIATTPMVEGRTIKIEKKPTFVTQKNDNDIHKNESLTLRKNQATAKINEAFESPKNEIQETTKVNRNFKMDSNVSRVVHVLKASSSSQSNTAETHPSSTGMNHGEKHSSPYEDVLKNLRNDGSPRSPREFFESERATLPNMGGYFLDSDESEEYLDSDDGEEYLDSDDGEIYVDSDDGEEYFELELELRAEDEDDISEYSELKLGTDDEECSWEERTVDTDDLWEEVTVEEELVLLSDDEADAASI